MALAKTIMLLLCLVSTGEGAWGALCIMPPRSAASTPRSTTSFLTARTPLPIVDWRAHGVVTPVMDQGNIGSCWAISAVGAIEGLHKIRTRRLVSLSSQQIYDCSNKSVIDSHLKAFNWVLHNGGGYQPVTVRMSLDRTSFQNYTGGIFSGPCGNDGHSMLAVGYGATADGRKYWIVKNSYGSRWGDHGYFYVQRGPNHGPGLCGLANYAAYPV
ncbi:hypothetical protein ZWY2020_059677 [Hordeum vulgare]|nr:hypothetical protein ZWY2020_059677 [Hordeum vulgare]